MTSVDIQFTDKSPKTKTVTFILTSETLEVEVTIVLYTSPSSQTCAERNYDIRYKKLNFFVTTEANVLKFSSDISDYYPH